MQILTGLPTGAGYAEERKGRPMDPDLVRQQEEAERESMRLAGRKQETPAPGLAGAIAIQERATPPSQPRSGRYTARSPLWYFGRFLSFALAGAMLGGGLGIAAANYMQLPVEAAKLVIFGPAGFFAIAFAFASFFTGKTAQPRASSGT
jgi:hypothetical protein